MENGTMLQYFEWYLPDDGTLWKRCAAEAKKLKEAGFTALWLPPAYKGAGGSGDVGYGVYDTYDLGEFDQKGTVRTKYGTREEYLKGVKALQKQGIDVLADIVLNHRMGADECEDVTAVEDNPSNRNQQTSGLEHFKAWTKLTFPGRKGKYSDFIWTKDCFDGTDWDESNKRKSVFLFEGKQWDNEVDSENGNYDYLMGADLDFTNTEVTEELTKWGRWYLQTVNMDGFRLDAVKHIGFAFFKDWLATLRRESGKELFAVGEYWSPEIGKLTHYLSACEDCMSLFDVPLHFNFHKASKGGGNYDMSKIFEGTLVQANPVKAVTFIDNHDSQPGQALESWVEPWFKPLAYAMILLRQEGYPCVFYGDYYGLPNIGCGQTSLLARMLTIRRLWAYGPQHDYIDDANVIGWTREGDAEKPQSGLAVVLSDGAGGSKQMYIGKQFAGVPFYDATGHYTEPVTVDAEGNGIFMTDGGNVTVWLQKTACDAALKEK